MVYGVGSFRQRPMIATAVQRSSNSTANQRTASLHRYCYRIVAVLLATAVYTVFLYSSGMLHSDVLLLAEKTFDYFLLVVLEHRSVTLSSSK